MHLHVPGGSHRLGAKTTNALSDSTRLQNPSHFPVGSRLWGGFASPPPRERLKVLVSLEIREALDELFACRGRRGARSVGNHRESRYLTQLVRVVGHHAHVMHQRSGRDPEIVCADQRALELKLTKNFSVLPLHPHAPR